MDTDPKPNESLLRVLCEYLTFADQSERKQLIKAIDKEAIPLWVVDIIESFNILFALVGLVLQQRNGF